MQGQGEFYDPKVAAQVARVGGGHGLDDEVPDLSGQDAQLLVVESP